jgi:hypothetical protein
LAEARQRLRCCARRPDAHQGLHLAQPRFTSGWPLEAHDCGPQSFRCPFPSSGRPVAAEESLELGTVFKNCSAPLIDSSCSRRSDQAPDKSFRAYSAASSALIAWPSLHAGSTCSGGSRLEYQRNRPAEVLAHLVIGYNSLAIPIAAGAFEPFGFTLRPEIAAISMSGSSVLVAVNALALKRLRLPRSQASIETASIRGNRR